MPLATFRFRLSPKRWDYTYTSVLLFLISFLVGTLFRSYPTRFSRLCYILRLYLPHTITLGVRFGKLTPEDEGQE